MSIQFNKVTWYSKFAAIIVAVAIIILCVYLNARYKEVENLRQSVLLSSGGVVTTNGDVAVPVDKSVTFDGLQITFDKIVQDSRCPIDVKCIRVGNTTAHIIMSSSGKVEEANLISDAVPYRFNNYLISFTRVGPVKYSKVEIDPKNYIAIFHVVNVLGF